MFEVVQRKSYVDIILYDRYPDIQRIERFLWNNLVIFIRDSVVKIIEIMLPVDLRLRYI
jgi:hypothetical protein